MAHQEFSKRYTTMLDREVQRLTGELALLRDNQAPSRSEEGSHGDVASLRHELLALTDRLDRLEQLCRSSAEERAAVSRCLGVVSEMDTRLQSVSVALEAERQARASRAVGGAEDGPGVAQLQAELVDVRREVQLLSQSIMGERTEVGQEVGRLRDITGFARAPAKADRFMEDCEQQNAEMEELRQRVEETHRASLASFQELAEGLMLECTSRQAQASDLRAALAEDLSTSINAVREALRADIAAHCREVRDELGARLTVLEAEFRCLGAQCSDGSQPQKDEIAARVAAIEAEVQRNMAAMGHHADEQLSDQQGADNQAHSLGEFEHQAFQEPLISPNLKETLEQLVDKVNKTLNPGIEKLEMSVGGSEGSGRASLVRNPSTAPSAMQVRNVAGSADVPQEYSLGGAQVRAVSPRRLVVQGPSSAALPPNSQRSGSMSFQTAVQHPLTAPYSSASTSTPQPPQVAPSRLVSGNPQVILGGSVVFPAQGGSMVFPAVRGGSVAFPAHAVVHKQTAPMVVQAQPPPPLVVLPMAHPASDAAAGPPSLQDSASATGSFIPDSIMHSPEKPKSEAPESNETFKRCLQELREENKALREGGTQSLGISSAATASVSFPVVAPHQARTVQVSHLQVAGVAGVPSVAQTLLLPNSGSIRMTPGAACRTISPVAEAHRGTSPTPASRRNFSPQRQGR